MAGNMFLALDCVCEAGGCRIVGLLRIFAFNANYLFLKKILDRIRWGGVI